jgi:hypothetical protein
MFFDRRKNIQRSCFESQHPLFTRELIYYLEVLAYNKKSSTIFIVEDSSSSCRSGGGNSSELSLIVEAPISDLL